MQKAIFWMLAIGALLVVSALALVGINRRKETSPTAGSPEQLAQAREAKEMKRILKSETETETEKTVQHETENIQS